MLAAQALAVHARGEVSPTSEATPVASAEPTAAAIATACAGCRGWCCRKGGEHTAHLTVDTLLRAIRRWPSEVGAPSADDLSDQYVAHSEATHAEGSCLFHGERGCRLPRSLRSEVCNTYLCRELFDVVAGWGPAGPGPEGHTFVAVSRKDKRPRVVQSLAKAASNAD